MAVNWNYYDNKKFHEVNKKYLPQEGQGDTMATQIVTAVNKLVYKWYNDGNVFDNTCYLAGYANDLSSYANWLYQNTDNTVQDILYGVFDCGESDYEDLLKELADTLLDEKYLKDYEKIPAVGTIFECDGCFKCVLDDNDEDEE